MSRFAEHRHFRHRQLGAALVTALALIAAVMLLAMTAVRETTVNTAMTQQFVAQITARMATASALEATLADLHTLSPVTTDRSYRFGPDRQFETSVVITYLGTVEAAGIESDRPAYRYYAVVVETIGPRNAGHRRQQYVRTATTSDR